MSYSYVVRGATWSIAHSKEHKGKRDFLWATERIPFDNAFRHSSTTTRSLEKDDIWDNPPEEYNHISMTITHMVDANF